MTNGFIQTKFRARILGHYTDIPPQKRLAIEKDKWFGGASSPVVFMVDDLTNAWAGDSQGSIAGPEYDWGGGHFHEKGVFHFLEKHLFSRFSSIRTTYFTVVGEMYPFTKDSQFSRALPLDSDPESLDFFQYIGFSDRSEIAYHGLHHGLPGVNATDYTQEWESFRNVEDGRAVAEAGKAIFRNVFGYFPLGGKYGGYKSNEWSEPIIEKTGFRWWCRDWTPRDTMGRLPHDLYEMTYFGNNRKVVSIPSTIHGKRWTKRQVDLLLSKKQVISIQEHICPHRPDNKIQTPNIFDDISSLIKLFGYLEGKNVWYATASEVAAYFVGYDRTLIYDVQKDSFRVEYNWDPDDPIISVKISAPCLCSAEFPHLSITLPGGQQLSGRHIRPTEGIPFCFEVDLPIRSGRYCLEPLERPPRELNGKFGMEGVVEFSHKDTCGMVEVSPPANGKGSLMLKSGEEIIRVKKNRKGNILFYCKDSSRTHQLMVVK